MIETLPLFVSSVEHQAVLDRLNDRATPVDEVGAELEALRCLRDNVEELVEVLDGPGDRDDVREALDDALRGVRAALAELRELDGDGGDL